jgi:ribosome-binding ATPase YchF (GTP1/OBG family)
MRIGLVGFAGSGKSTAFEWLTGEKPDPAAINKGQLATARIPDPRLNWLSDHFKPKKTTFATLELIDTPGLNPLERKDNPRRLAIIREADGLLVVLTGYTVGNPEKELADFREEMFFSDLEIVTNRIQRLEPQLKKPKPAREKEADQKEIDLLKRISAALESGTYLATLGLTADEEKSIRSFQLLTLKPLMVLLNIGDNRLGQPLPETLAMLQPAAMQVAIKLEMELNELSEEERQAFMSDLGLEGFSRDATLRWVFGGMGRIVFFTVGEDECRAWPIQNGETAQSGAGVIHTDLSSRFVRAEIVPYEDYKRLGSMKEAKAQGIYRLEGKTYLVKDGDIMHILAST